MELRKRKEHHVLLLELFGLGILFCLPDHFIFVHEMNDTGNYQIYVDNYVTLFD